MLFSSSSPSSSSPSQDIQQGTALAKQTPWDINSISSALKHSLSARPDIIMNKSNLLIFPGNGFLNLFVKAHLANFILFELEGLKGKCLKVIAQLCKSGNCIHSAQNVFCGSIQFTTSKPLNLLSRNYKQLQILVLTN